MTIAQSVGRNDPCPCGSGKKFKQCCAAAGQAPKPAWAGTPTQATDARHQAKAAEDFYRRGIELIEARRPTEAALALRKAIEHDPERAASHHAHGVALLNAGHVGAAEISLRQAVALDPRLANAHRDLGVALDRQGRSLEAVQALEQAVAYSPKLSDTHRRIGELWLKFGQTAKAVAAYHRAAATARDTAVGWLLRARALVLEGKFRDAELVLRKLVALERNNTKAANALGDVLVIQGRFSEGIRHFERALAVNPRETNAWLLIAQAAKFTEADRHRFDDMQAAMGQDGLTDKNRMTLHFAIGKASDDLRDYEGATRHFDAANRIRSLTSRFDRSAFTARVDRLIRRFTPRFFAEHTAFGTADETPLLILGMPRSGTTLVEQIVSSHPEVAAGEELVYWTSLHAATEAAEGDGFKAKAVATLATGYLEILRGISATASRVTDKMPFNFLPLGLIHLVLPNTRIIHCRRNPIDTCLSIYSTMFDSTIDFAASKEDLAFYYTQYSRLMDHWRTVLPHDRFIEVQYERLINNPEAETRRLVAFTGLDWNDACLRPEDNERVVMTASVWQARQPVYRSSVERWRRYEPWLGELATLAECGNASEMPGR